MKTFSVASHQVFERRPSGTAALRLLHHLREIVVVDHVLRWRSLFSQIAGDVSQRGIVGIIRRRESRIILRSQVHGANTTSKCTVQESLYFAKPQHGNSAKAAILPEGTPEVIVWRERRNGTTPANLGNDYFWDEE